MASLIEAPTRESIRPLPPDTRITIEPYRVLFPLGAACAIAGALPWVLLPWNPGAWPGSLHASLMVQGFELAFVAGFLLTAMPAFTHGAKCRPWELWGAVSGVVLFASIRVVSEPLAQAVFVLTLGFTGLALARRVRGGAAAPPEEFALVGVGMVLGIAGGVLQGLSAAGLMTEPSPRFGLHLISRGMLLGIVLGIGGLLVPTFEMITDPLRIVGVARPGQRAPRRAFVTGLALLIVAALAAESFGRPGIGGWLRAGAGTASLLLAWKLWRRPPRPLRLPWTLWCAGVCMLLGLLGAALFPVHEVAAWHVVLIGGYGLLTMAIGTRVVIAHGRHDSRGEAALLGIPALAGVGLAMLVRLAAGEIDPRLSGMLAAAAGLWILAWGLWLAAALPRVLRIHRALVMPGGPVGR